MDSDGLYYFDPSNKTHSSKGKAVHLAIDYACFLCENSVNILLDTLSDRELKGRAYEYGSFLMALQVAINLREGSKTYEEGEVDIDKEIDGLFATINHADFAHLCNLDFSHIDFDQLELDTFDDALEHHEVDQQTMDTFTAFLATHKIDGDATKSMKELIASTTDGDGKPIEGIPDNLMDMMVCLQ